MQETEHDLSDWNPFHVTLWPHLISLPEQYEGGDRLSLSWDLGAVPESEKKRVIKQWHARLPELQQLRWLKLWSQVTPPVFEAACRHCDARKVARHEAAFMAAKAEGQAG